MTNSTNAVLALNLAFAEQHIAALTGAPDTPVVIQVFDDSEASDNRLADHKLGTVRGLWSWIKHKQSEGCGVFATVNEMHGEQRGKKYLSKYRAVWSDDDKPRAAPRSDWPITPSITAESSPGKYHYYWVTSDANREQWPGVLDRLVADWGADNSAKDAARVLRLAGTLHLKNPAAPHLVRIVHAGEYRPYAWADITKAFPPVVAPDGSAGKIPFVADAAIEAIKNREPGLHDNLRDLAAHYAARAMSEKVCERYLHLEMKAADDGTPRWAARAAEIPRLVRSAYAKYTPFGSADDASATSRDPLDIFGTAGEFSAPFVSGDYPDAIAALAQDVARRTGCDPLIAAWSAIVVVAGLLDDRFKVQVKAHDTGWRESARLWVTLVGEPSTKKSPAMSAALRPVEDAQASQWSAYQESERIWERLAADARKAKQPEPPRPQPRRLLVHDATTEAVGGVLAANPAGVFVAQDELSGWFGALDAYRPNGSTKDAAFWLQAYNGAPYIVDRKSTGTLLIPNLSVSMLGGIQPGPMRSIGKKLAQDGLLQRFICIPVHAASAGEDVPPDTLANETWKALVNELVAVRDDLFCEWPELCTLSPGAQREVDAARARLHAMACSPAIDRRLSAALAKGEGQLARLVLTYHLIENRADRAPCDGSPIPSATITTETGAKAVRVFFGLVVPSAHDFYGRIIGLSETHEHARWIAGYILARGLDSIAERDIYRAYKSLQGEDGKRDIAAAMQQLELASWVSPVLSDKGRAPTRWLVNQHVHVKFAQRAAAERERRERELANFRVLTQNGAGK